jgi:cytochrome oxidase Cu insertion factor (SCO1/SenC/PrrC family)
MRKFALLFMFFGLVAETRSENLMLPDLDQVRGRLLPDVTVEDDTGAPFSLSSLRSEKRAVIVVPFYSRCKASCSPTTESLKNAIASSRLDKSDYRIISFSFDPDETVERIRAFRSAHHLPDDWKIVRADPAVINAVLDAMDFHVLSMAKEDYEHSNLVTIYDPNLRLHGFLFASWLKPEDITNMVHSAQGRPASSFFGYGFLGVGVFGLLCSAVFTALASRYYRKRVKGS